MKAITHTQYGGPELLTYTEIDKPQPRENEILINIHATALNAADWRLMRADPFLIRLMNGLLKPKNNVLGADIAGQVAAVGKNVHQFKIGDAVFGDLSSHGFGGLAEYVCVPQDAVAHKPANLNFRQAAAVPMAALTALHGLRDTGNIQAGQGVLVHGASGGVGTFAIQIAKAFGATVTAVCSTSKASLARSLGADHVIDYKKEDFAQNGRQYDLVIAVNGNRTPADYIKVLKPNGVYVVAGGSMSQLFGSIVFGSIKTIGTKQRVRSFTSDPNQKDLEFLAKLIEEEKIAPVIDQCYELDETNEAIRYLEAGRARGKVVVTMPS